MASNYEVEHNIQAPAKPPHKRRPDMSSFTSLLHQISPDNDAAATPSRTRHVGPTPVDMAAMFGLLHAQYARLRADSPSAENQRLLESLAAELEADMGSPPDAVPGVPQEYLDGLDRVSTKSLKKGDDCPICAEEFLADPYPLVVELPCPGRHRFDLECVGPWLLGKGTCPMCRHDLTKKKAVEIPKDDDEDELDDVDGLYG
ncbi:hypothetical protein F4820DRAFT_7261 [Hypoxylon rubiginosum]|uniref:Uncharacterized protein n=1 Tax=Hypoxylon rubiginosum TaxID=110542 RepID=A0ACB9ZJ16_9PEZI|nr:hypothetical protein F4820DRAFT_7261 [Hypoxylon rubiginosum]